MEEKIRPKYYTPVEDTREDGWVYFKIWKRLRNEIEM